MSTPAESRATNQAAARAMAAGVLAGAEAALRETLSLEGHDSLALLMSATFLEQLGQARQAASAYGVALANAPPGSTPRSSGPSSGAPRP